MTRKKLLIGNWKLNHTQSSAKDFFEQILSFLSADESLDIAIAPVAPMLDFVNRLLEEKIELAAQNVFYASNGAFTGEWSAENLLELKVRYCIVGHSERRALFNETDEVIAKKANACLNAGIVPVICVGETLKERDNDQTGTIIERQVSSVITNLKVEQGEDIVFAYEPVWAIGSGKNATKEQAQEIHLLIRELLANSLGNQVAKATRIIYGGSVSPENIAEIGSMRDIDGALVGGASLQAASFLTMVKKLRDGC